MMENTRRNFIKNSALGALAAVSLPDIVAAAANTAKKNKKISLAENDIFLFQGDSITDAGRVRTELTGLNAKALGTGYAFFTAGDMLKQFPTKNLAIYNRGISGNKVFQLADRWDIDCLSLQPTVLSLMIGVNDFWHTLTSGYKGTVDTYHDDYIKLLDRTKAALPNVKLIIAEPFFVNGIRPEDDKWHPAFDEYQKTAKQIADKYDAVFIPLQSIFNEAVKHAPPKYWTADGVHPGMAGQSLMAQAWMETLQG